MSFIVASAGPEGLPVLGNRAGACFSFPSSQGSPGSASCSRVRGSEGRRRPSSSESLLLESVLILEVIGAAPMAKFPSLTPNGTRAGRLSRLATMTPVPSVLIRNDCSPVAESVSSITALPVVIAGSLFLIGEVKRLKLF